MGKRMRKGHQMTHQAVCRKTPAYTLERYHSTPGMGYSGGSGPPRGRSHPRRIIPPFQIQSPGPSVPGGSPPAVALDTVLESSADASSYPTFRTSDRSRWHPRSAHNPHHRHTALFGPPGNQTPCNVHGRCREEDHRSKGHSWEDRCWTTGGWLGKLALDDQPVCILRHRHMSPCC